MSIYVSLALFVIGVVWLVVFFIMAANVAAIRKLLERQAAEQVSKEPRP